eukprot:m.141220 g.141220  ORF g.141220 m.141220 type:complete len:246 (-) comp37811_c0_seq1:8-745(-)
MKMDYFDIDSVLMEEEKVKCNPLLDIIKMGELNNSETNYLPKGSKMELPLWLIKTLREKMNEDLFLVTEPNFLNVPHMEMLEADASVVNLNSWCTHFFDFAFEYLSLFPTQAMEETVVKSFGDRYMGILDTAQSSLHRDVNDKTRKFDTLEKSIFAKTVVNEKAFRAWLHRQGNDIVKWKGAKSRSQLATIRSTSTSTSTTTATSTSSSSTLQASQSSLSGRRGISNNNSSRGGRGNPSKKSKPK